MPKVRRLPLASAEFNLREIVKQLILLEDHLSDPEKYCEDCIRKHLLHAEGLAEEAVMLEPKGWVLTQSNAIANKTRQWMAAFSDGVDPYTLSQTIRKSRKKIMNKAYDPRELN